jgi:hypothetical protein
MSPAADPASLRARRLLRWYPRPWRDRYGEEFTELLISDIRERPHSTRRALDVARGGMLARLADAGLAGFPLRAATAGGRVGASLGSFGGALGVFLVFGAALLVRRARISSRVAMFEARLGLLACVAMAVLVAGDGGWIVHEVRVAPWLPLGLSVGFVNVTIAVVLALALAVAVRAARMALAGLRQAGS